MESASVAPVDVDGVGAVAVGTVLWGVGLVLTVVFHGPLEAAGNGWWTWVCLSGLLLGLLGLPYVIRRRAAYRSSDESVSSS